jgi:predicted membrane channel-forming protein YqfA (hemolysin III family)
MISTTINMYNKQLDQTVTLLRADDYCMMYAFILHTYIFAYKVLRETKIILNLIEVQLLNSSKTIASDL